MHFLLLGALLFAAERLFNGAADNALEIRVGREQLVTMLQFRAKTFDQERFDDELDRMGEDARRKLEQEWLREELLYREAKALQLDRDDYVIRQRLANKMEFIARGFISNDGNLPREQVEDYFDRHKDDYLQPASITFTHVFFSSAIHGRQRAAQLAESALETLRADGVAFEQANGYGDQFAYHSNYVERSRDYVAAQFDEQFARELFVPEGDDGEWQGPLESVLGFHLVLVADRQPARPALLANIYAQVEADAREARVQREVDQVIAKLKNRYRIIDGNSDS
ncbi:peptidyl-prolyl cis-trans isomerase [Microbulbifer pacificus]|uniref:peptidyl-prolyl cis-trans isomerase n=1 Tax=Microbulbifer pacificus TaxID=407164 RepID=UPI00131A02A7|nr:peptidyl-prolyl cis-trans isomerase [Microbulbifer pacificus]